MKSVAFQAMLYATLSGDVTLNALLSGEWGTTAIFADVPQADESEDDSLFPYVTFGPETAERYDDKGAVGGDVTFQIDIWTRSRDFAVAKAIADRIVALLHRQDLTISGANHIATGLESVQYTIDPDGQTRRGMMLFRTTYQDS